MAEGKLGINWARVAVRDDHGALSQEETMRAVSEDFARWVAENEVNTPVIAAAVQAVFESMGPAENKQKELNVVAVQALRHLQVPVDGEALFMDRVRQFIRAESKRFEATQGASGAYWIAKGPRSGVRVSTPKVVADYKALLERKAAKNGGPVINVDELE